LRQTRDAGEGKRREVICVCDIGEKRGLAKMDISVGDVMEAYEGPVGLLWEMLMGEQIHVGGERETDILAQMAGVDADLRVLDVLSGLGGPARHLSRRYGATAIGLDVTPRMVDGALRRTRDANLDDRVDFRLGNALDMPFRANTFDIVWGQDSWCYVTDKGRLIDEAFRVLKPGGEIAFTDWIRTGPMSEEEWHSLNTFMVFPYMETLDGYRKLLVRSGFRVEAAEDLSDDFARHMHLYRDTLENGLKADVIRRFGEGVYAGAQRGLDLWVRAADEGKVGRGRMIGRKP
jgi:ubiquinone/menaquinone biosynthesis C-methylase UbiE